MLSSTTHKRPGMSPSPIQKFLKIVSMKILDNSIAIVAVPLTIAAIFVKARLKPIEFTDRIQAFISHSRIFPIGLFLAIAVIVYIMQRPRKVYLIDYACFRTTYHYRAPRASFVEHLRQMGHFNERSVRFLTRLLERSGLGEETCLPPVSHYFKAYKYCTLDAGREEVQLVVFSAINDLLAKTNIAPTTIDIVIVNCSGFCPTPSFADMIMNKYKMRSDIRAIHLSGMGCSAGLISIELAKNLMQAMPHGARALVVSTETLSPLFYLGNERAMLLPYCLFRMGGAAVLLSTSPAKARFRLKCLVRTLSAASDNSYQCIHQEEDDKGNTGVNLSMELMVVAGNTLKSNITTIAPLILPASEKLHFVMSFIATKLLKMKKTKLYVPNFLSAVEHICIHAGGRAVIDEIQRSLGLSDEHVEPSRMTLHRFGNISSSSLWYEMAYIEAKRRMHRGDRLWMIGFGSGFKCNSAVWECIVPARNEDGPWASCIHRYPVHIP